MRHDVPMLAAKKLPPLVVESHAVLSFAGLDGHPHGTGIKGEIASESHRFLRRSIGIHYVTGVAIDQTMNPIVESPRQASKHAFRLQCASAASPTGENHFLFVRHTVTVGVLQEEQVRY